MKIFVIGQHTPTSWFLDTDTSAWRLHFLWGFLGVLSTAASVLSWPRIKERMWETMWGTLGTIFAGVYIPCTYTHSDPQAIDQDTVTWCPPDRRELRCFSCVPWKKRQKNRYWWTVASISHKEDKVNYYLYPLPGQNKDLKVPQLPS